LVKFSGELENFKIFFGSLESNDKKLENRIVEINDLLAQVLSCGGDAKGSSKTNMI